MDKAELSLAKFILESRRVKDKTMTKKLARLVAKRNKTVEPQGTFSPVPLPCVVCVAVGEQKWIKVIRMIISEKLIKGSPLEHIAVSNSHHLTSPRESRYKGMVTCSSIPQHAANHIVGPQVMK